jgi:hypothetical protein
LPAAAVMRISTSRVWPAATCGAVRLAVKFCVCPGRIVSDGEQPGPEQLAPLTLIRI